MGSWETFFHAEFPDWLVQLAISRDRDWTGWCRYFLEAVQAQAMQSQ